MKAASVQLEKQIDSYEVEIYKKYSIPFACVVFILVGAPLGYRVRSGGFGIAAGLSLLFFLLYWACLMGGEKLADRAYCKSDHRNVDCKHYNRMFWFVFNV